MQEASSHAPKIYGAGRRAHRERRRNNKDAHPYQVDARSTGLLPLDWFPANRLVSATQVSGGLKSSTRLLEGGAINVEELYLHTAGASVQCIGGCLECSVRSLFRPLKQAMNRSSCSRFCDPSASGRLAASREEEPLGSRDVR